MLVLHNPYHGVYHRQVRSLFRIDQFGISIGCFAAFGNFGNFGLKYRDKILMCEQGLNSFILESFFSEQIVLAQRFGALLLWTGKFCIIILILNPNRSFKTFKFITGYLVWNEMQSNRNQTKIILFTFLFQLPTGFLHYLKNKEQN